MERNNKPYTRTVADRIIKSLKSGTSPFQQPWNNNALLPYNPITGNRYRGVNLINLMCQDRVDPRWLTYKQAQSLGAQVRAKEKSSVIQYYKTTEKEHHIDENGVNVEREIMLERPKVFFANVFNAEQIDNMPPIEKTIKQWENLDHVETILKNSSANIVHGSSKAYYTPLQDVIYLPNKENFNGRAAYYAIALHELGHWTGHESRLNRDLKHPFGSDEYAREELRAEIASLIMGEDFGIGRDPSHHMSYIKSWVKLLEDEPQEIFKAAADAEHIQKYISNLNLQQEVTVKNAVSSNKTVAPTMTQINENKKVFLKVPFHEKDEAKTLGAKWDKQERAWYISDNDNMQSFQKWPVLKSETVDNNRHNEKIYLTVPYENKDEAKQHGAKWDKANKSWYVMSDNMNETLNKWLPQNNLNESPVISPRDEFSERLNSLGIIVSGEHPIFDGETHRIETVGDKNGKKSGFYVAYGDGHPAGYAKNNKTGEEMRWKSKGYVLSEFDKQNLHLEAERRKKQRNDEISKKQEELSQKVVEFKKTLENVKPNNPYLQSKGIAPTKDTYTDQSRAVYVPLYDENAKLWSIQTIYFDGSKNFMKDAKKSGCFHVINGFDGLKKAPVIVIAEGYATAVTLSETLGMATVSALDAGNLKSVAEKLRDKFPDKSIVIAGDNDHLTQKSTGKNPGVEKALEAAKQVNGFAVFPTFAMGEDALTDFNDLAHKSKLGKKAIDRQVKEVIKKLVKQNVKSKSLEERIHGFFRSR